MRAVLLLLAILVTTFNVSGFAHAGLPGSKAFWKGLSMGIPKSVGTPVSFQLSGFRPTVRVEKDKNELVMSWKFLAQSQAVVDQYATTDVPKLDLTRSEEYFVLFSQVAQCRALSNVTINDDLQYVVSGTCIGELEVIIPHDFPENVSINGELIYRP